MKGIPELHADLPDPAVIGNGLDLAFALVEKRLMTVYKWHEKYKQVFKKPFERSRSSETFNPSIVTVFDGTSAYIVNGEVYIGKIVLSEAEFSREFFIQEKRGPRTEFFEPVKRTRVVFDTVSRNTVSHVVRFHVMMNRKGESFFTDPWDDGCYGKDGEIVKIIPVASFNSPSCPSCASSLVRVETKQTGYTVEKKRTSTSAAVLKIWPSASLKSSGITAEQAKKNALDYLIVECLSQACEHASTMSINEDSIGLILSEIDDMIVEIFKYAKDRIEKNEYYKRMLGEKDPIEKIDEIFNEWNEKNEKI